MSDSHQFDVAIIGAGVAGAMSAVKLSRRGLRVVLMDKASLPRHKVCGCCLNREAVAELRAQGFGSLCDAADPVRLLALHAAGRTTQMQLPEGVVLSRYALDQALATAAEDAGAVVWDRSVARMSPAKQASAQVTRDGETFEIKAKAILVADGLAGSALAGCDAFEREVKLNSKRGYGTHLPADQHTHRRGTISMRCGRQGYVGAVVLEDGSLDLAAAMDPVYVKNLGGIGPATNNIIEQSGMPLPISADLTTAKWSATPPLTGGRSSRWSPTMPGVLLVGDSAGYVEPFTGEGMAWALAGASAVTEIVERIVAQGWHDSVGLAWDRAYRRRVARRQWRCRAVAAGLDRPRLAAAVVGGLQATPRVLRPMLDRVLTPGGISRRENRRAICGQ